MKVAGYLRSSEGQDKGALSLADQKAKLTAFVCGRGWELIEPLYEDLACSGADNTRPAYLRLKQDVKARKFDAILVSKLDRVARSTRELLEFVEVCKQNNVDIISLAEAIDTTTPEGRYFFTTTSALAQLEREITSERVKASAPIRAKQGKPLGGQAIYGYKWEPIPGDEKHKRLVPVPEEARVIRLMHQLYIEHGRTRTVARMLNEKGYRTRKGGLFTGTTVRRLIEDTTAKGKARTA